MATVRLNEVISKMNVENLTPQIDVSKIRIRQPDINRPALQLTGYFEHFAAGRIQIIGLVEYSYMQQMKYEDKERIYRKFLSLDIPCIVFCRELEPDELFISIALENSVPVLMTRTATSNFTSELIRWLNVRLAPCITIHGVLIDVYGVGVLITGESGTAPEITKHLIELRGIGIIDVKTLFGVSSVRNSQNIDLVIELEEWSKEKDFDRLGLEEHYIEYLGNRVVCHKIPIRPGRNLAIICEAAAVNHRQKAMGYNAAQELYKRVQANLMSGHRNDEDE